MKINCLIRIVKVISNTFTAMDEEITEGEDYLEEDSEEGEDVEDINGDWDIPVEEQSTVEMFN
jgi:hypothetical protein